MKLISAAKITLSRYTRCPRCGQLIPRFYKFAMAKEKEYDSWTLVCWDCFIKSPNEIESCKTPLRLHLKFIRNSGELKTHYCLAHLVVWCEKEKHKEES